MAKQSVMRLGLAWASAAIACILVRVRYKDATCGAKTLHHNVAYRLAQVVKKASWVFDVVLPFSAASLILKLVEHPVVWAQRGGLRLRIPPTARRVLRSLRGLKPRQTKVVADKRSSQQNLPKDARSSLRILALNWRCLCHPQSGGCEINLFEQARRWVRDGHTVTVVCADPGRQHASRRHEFVDGVEVLRMGGRFTVYLCAMLFLLRHAGEFDRILDVANGIPFFAPLFTRTPVVLLVHHIHERQWFIEFPYPIAAVGWFIERRIMPYVYRNRPVIAVSPSTRDELVNIGVPKSQIRIVYNGVKPQDLCVGEIRTQGPRIAYVGRFKRYKRLDRLVRAIAVLRHQFPDIHLDLAGDGDARAEIEALVDRLDLTKYVTVYGYVDEQTKVEILRSATVFATPSVHEGWGMSVIEANAYGCPAVAYDVPGLRAAIRHGETGLLANDDASFQQALALLLGDAELRARYSAAARSWATTFDWEASAWATLEMLYTAANCQCRRSVADMWEEDEVVLHR